MGIIYPVMHKLIINCNINCYYGVIMKIPVQGICDDYNFVIILILT